MHWNSKLRKCCLVRPFSFVIFCIFEQNYQVCKLFSYYSKLILLRLRFKNVLLKSVSLLTSVPPGIKGLIWNSYSFYPF